MEARRWRYGGSSRVEASRRLGGRPDRRRGRQRRRCGNQSFDPDQWSVRHTRPSSRGLRGRSCLHVSHWSAKEPETRVTVTQKAEFNTWESRFPPSASHSVQEWHLFSFFDRNMKSHIFLCLKPQFVHRCVFDQNFKRDIFNWDAVFKPFSQAALNTFISCFLSCLKFIFSRGSAPTLVEYVRHIQSTILFSCLFIILNHGWFNS